MTKTNTKKLAVAGIFCTAAVVEACFPFRFSEANAPIPAHGQHTVCGAVKARIWRWSGICGIIDPQSAWSWKSDGFSGQYVWRIGLWSGLLQNENIFATLLGEVFGTAILGGLSAYPIAVFFMGQSAAGLAFYAYIIPFLISTAGGAIISAVLIYSLKKAGILHTMQESLPDKRGRTMFLKMFENVRTKNPLIHTTLPTM